MSPQLPFYIRKAYGDERSRRVHGLVERETVTKNWRRGGLPEYFITGNYNMATHWRPSSDYGNRNGLAAAFRKEHFKIIKHIHNYFPNQIL